MSNSFSDAVNKILSENKSIDINQSGKTLVEKVNDIQIDRDGQDKFHREKKLLGPGRFKKWFKRRTLKKSDMTDQEQEQHHQDNRKLAASGVKDSVEYTGEPMNETHAPGSVEMVYGKHKVIDTGKEDRYGFQMYDVHHGGKKTHSNVRLRTAKEVLDNVRKKTTEKANKKLENPKESVELDEAQRPTRTAVNQEFKRVHGKQMDTGAATRHVEKKFNINNVKVQKDKNGNRHVISFDESVELGEEDTIPNRSGKVLIKHDLRTPSTSTHNVSDPKNKEDRIRRTRASALITADPERMKRVEKKRNIRTVRPEPVVGTTNIKLDSYDATSAADDFLNELSQEFGAENITLDTIMENISELETLLTSLKEYFGIDESAEGDTILTAHDMASTNDPYEHQEMAVQKIKDLINKERNEETKTKESNNGN